MSVPARKIKVLVVDDSVVVRRMLGRILDADPEIEVVDTARDPYDAEAKILKLKPDVLTLDIEMPKMDGLTFLRILMEKRPMPVIIMSSLSQEGSRYAMEALSSGAVDVLAKPYGPYSVGSAGEQLVQKVKAASIARLRRPSPRAPTPARIGGAGLAATSRVKEASPPPRPQTASGGAPRTQAPMPKPVKPLQPRQLILLGASTGGTEALKEILLDFPREVPGICIVQHIPPYFSKAFADRLNGICTIDVKEAEDGDRVRPGLALIAPGDYHMTLAWAGDGYRVGLRQGPSVWHQRPAVDILFKTGAQCAGAHATAAIFTGMGRDGAEGLLDLRKAGARTFAQDEASCVVYGMPKAAVELGAAQEVLPLSKLSAAILKAAYAQS